MQMASSDGCHRLVVLDIIVHGRLDAALEERLPSARPVANHHGQPLVDMSSS